MDTIASDQNALPIRQHMRSSFTFLLTLLCLLILYYLWKFLMPAGITKLYALEHFDVLNRLAAVSDQRPLEFYLGRIDRLIVGPLSQVFSGLLFLWACLRFRLHASSVRLATAIFIYLVLTKLEILLFPPFAEAVHGPFAEALWLYHHNLNYVELSRQPGYIYGGPKVYLFSLYPTLQALLMKLLPSTKLFLVVNHLIAFACGTVAVVCFHRMARAVFCERVALLSSLLLLSLPLVQAQTEIINMEVPTLALMMISLAYLAEKRFWPATVWALLAMLCKGIAVFLCGVVLVMCLLEACSTRATIRKRLEILAPLLLMSACAALIVFVAFFVLYEKGDVDMVGWLQGWPELSKFFGTYLFAACLSIFTALGLAALLRPSRRAQWLDRYRIPLIMFLGGAGWFVLFLQSLAGTARYKLTVAPFIVFAVVYVLHRILDGMGRTSALRWILITAIAGSFYMGYGAFHRPIPAVDQITDHTVLERSLEYRNEQILRMRLARTVETKYAGLAVVAPVLIAHEMAMPELGFVARTPPATWIYGFPCQYANIRNYNGQGQLNLYNTLWVGRKEEVPEPVNRWLNDTYPVGQRDLLLERIVYGDREAMLFMGGTAIETRRQINARLLKQLQDMYNITDPHKHKLGLK